MILPTTNEILTAIVIKYGVNIEDIEKSFDPETVRLLKALNLQLLQGVGGDSPFDGNRPVLREGLPFTGEIIGGATFSEFLENLFFVAMPLVDLVIIGESILEYGLSGVGLDRSLNWDVDRRTDAISFISVAGIEIVATGEDQFGNQAVQLNENVTNTYTLIARDVNALEATRSVSFYFRHGYYWGAVADIGAITDADIMALVGADAGTGKSLDTVRQKTFNGINGNGNYLVFAFPASWGEPTFKINGLVNNAFTKVRNDNFGNQHGYSEPYQVWASNTKQNAPIVEFEIL